MTLWLDEQGDERLSRSYCAYRGKYLFDSIFRGAPVEVPSGLMIVIFELLVSFNPLPYKTFRCLSIFCSMFASHFKSSKQMRTEKINLAL